MAAYAALVSLMNTMDNIQNHPRLSTFLDKYQIESLCEKLDFLLDFVESHNCHIGGISKEEVEYLESQIASAAHAAEDVIESHIVDQILAGSTEESCSFRLHLQKMIEDMDSIMETVIEVEKERGIKDQQPKSTMPAASSRHLTPGKATVVGFDSYLVQLLDWLTGQQSDRQIIPITGMAGISKTTLARNVYENSLIVQHFDVRAWVAVSQEYNVKEILLQTLSGLGESTTELKRKTDDELGGQLLKILFRRRYLIILNDMWSIEAWNKIRFFFPENDNRSRIVVTTRQSDVANQFGSLRLALNFLDDNKSWDLFSEKAFAQGCCPKELENIGWKIVKKCKGLPLSIVVIGGLLGKSSRMQEYWENVEKDLSSILNSAEDNQCLNILSLSYIHLPAHLKPCFIYLGIFSEDHEIHVSRLVKLWVAEGFLKPNKKESLEEVAKGYIKDLADRNLLLVRSLSPNGEVKTCNIHDLLRDLCIKVAEKEKFFRLMRELDTLRDLHRERRPITVKSIAKEEYHRQFFRILQSTSLARSIIIEIPFRLSSKSGLLRVFSDAYGDSLDTAFRQVNLRFLECHPGRQNVPIYSYKLPSSVSLLWNLQTLIIGGTVVEVVAPSEIWEMQQLRHLKFYQVYLPKPPLSDKQNRIVLNNLQTLRAAWIFDCNEEVYKRMPNIKKLHIFFDNNYWACYTMAYYYFYNIGCLNKLESLHLDSRHVAIQSDLLRNLKFPSSLKKLALINCRLNWYDVAKISSLPHLQVLKLDLDSVVGPEWNPVEGEFLHLKYLRISKCSDLIYWNADSSHFPVLENLVLQELWKLDEIPSGIGEIPTLRDIYVVDCSVSSVISAMKILEEQEHLGNEDLQVRVKFWHKEKQEEFRKRMEEEGFASHNFQLS